MHYMAAFGGCFNPHLYFPAFQSERSGGPIKVHGKTLVPDYLQPYVLAPSPTPIAVDIKTFSKVCLEGIINPVTSISVLSRHEIKVSYDLRT